MTSTLLTLSELTGTLPLAAPSSQEVTEIAGNGAMTGFNTSSRCLQFASSPFGRIISLGYGITRRCLGDSIAQSPDEGMSVRVADIKGMF